MSAFAGVVSFEGLLPDKNMEDVVSRALTARRQGPTVTRRLEGALFAQRISPNPADPLGEPPPWTFRGGRALFAAAARLDNRDELGAALGHSYTELAQTRDAEILLRMIERWDDAGLARCVGTFAFALWDAGARRLILGRDCLGNKPLFYHCGKDYVAFATMPGALLALPGVPREIDEIALAHFMAFSLDEGRRTLYRGIDRVPSRTLATIGPAGVVHRQYWSPDLDAAPPYRRDEDYIERARELLDQAVAAAIRDTPRVAISTSGGLDSSAVAATAARLGRSDSITCFTLLPPPGTQVDVGPYKYPDERQNVEALARMHPQLDVRWIVPAELHPVEQDYTRFFAQADLPALSPAAYGAFSYIRDAIITAGHPVVLVGTLGNLGLSWWGRLAFPALLRAGRWGELTRELRMAATQSRRNLARTFAGEVLMPIIPTALGRAVNRVRGRKLDSVAHYSALNPAFIAEHELARDWRAQGFDPRFVVRGWNSVRHRAAGLFDTQQIRRDLAGMTEEMYGYETRDPHGDRRLLEFVLAVPEPMYRRGGVVRAFARQVLADRLPPEILAESRRGAQVTDWFSRLQVRRQDIAAEIERLDTSPLARRLIDVPRLKRLMVEWPKDEHEAQMRLPDYMLALARGVHVGQFVRWVEGETMNPHRNPSIAP
jgi:asparagine synthase (glutamine-hydrolysing)